MKTKRINIIVWMAIVHLFAIVCPNHAETRMGASYECPNFVVILVDNMGYGDLACYGSKLNQ